MNYMVYNVTRKHVALSRLNINGDQASQDLTSSFMAKYRLQVRFKR